MGVGSTYQWCGIHTHRLLLGVKNKNIEFSGVYASVFREKSGLNRRTPYCSPFHQLSNEINRNSLALTVFDLELF